MQSLYCESEEQRKSTQKRKGCLQISTNWQSWYACSRFRCCLIRSALFCAPKTKQRSSISFILSFIKRSIHSHVKLLVAFWCLCSTTPAAWIKRKLPNCDCMKNFVLRILLRPPIFWQTCPCWQRCLWDIFLRITSISKLIISLKPNKISWSVITDGDEIEQ